MFPLSTTALPWLTVGLFIHVFVRGERITWRWWPRFGVDKHMDAGWKTAGWHVNLCLSPSSFDCGTSVNNVQNLKMCLKHYFRLFGLWVTLYFKYPFHSQTLMLDIYSRSYTPEENSFFFVLFFFKWDKTLKDVFLTLLDQICGHTMHPFNNVCPKSSNCISLYSYMKIQFYFLPVKQNKMCAYAGLNQTHPTKSTKQWIFQDLFNSLLAIAWCVQNVCSVFPKYRGYGPLGQNFCSAGPLSGTSDSDFTVDL